MHATVLLRALGYSTQDLLNYFYSTETVFIEKAGKFSKSIEFDILSGQRATRDIKVGGEVLVKKNTKFTKAAIKKLRESKVDRLPIETDELVGKVAAHDVVDKETGDSSSATKSSPRRRSSASARRASSRSRCCSSTGSTWGPTSARRSSPTR